ncbi:MAG: sirohydrochlorin chelatase [Methylacidiphilales bacterium]|nr:sirohydrochlorin chelatase [Candidatus Methylacidiphilales bacterium]NJR18426.1 sirohydrochlorin chelatase [Calothrix sp. CSU_2_0]
MPSAYLLLSHGSHDARSQIAMQKLAQQLSSWREYRLQNSTGEATQSQLDNASTISETVVGTAYLELQPQPLHIQISEFVKPFILSPQQPLHLKILPLFLLSGMHVMEDIPAEIELAKQMLGQKFEIELQPYLGSYHELGQLLAKQLTASPAEKYILMAHGSRRPGFQAPMEKIISNLAGLNLEVTTAYWAVPPSLEESVGELVASGYKRITIAPYFLFPGGITDAIAIAVEKLQLQFPGVSLNLTEPLGTSTELADLIWDLLQK